MWNEVPVDYEKPSHCQNSIYNNRWHEVATAIPAVAAWDLGPDYRNININMVQIQKTYLEDMSFRNM